jgi:hypothetical protein
VMSRGFASATRRVSFATLIIALLITVLSLNWGALTAATRAITPVLGPTARAALAGSRAVTPGLLNLTHSPAAEQMPAWSPNGQTIAFSSDGLDSNGDGRIDTTGSTRALYTINADGSGLERYALSAGTVTALTWDAAGTGIYLAVHAGGVTTIQRMTLATKTATVLYTATGAITGLAATGSDQGLLFDMVSADGRTDIYLLPLAPTGAAAQQLTARQGNNRAPSLSSDGTEIVFSSNRSGRWRIYRMYLDGGTPRLLTTSISGDDSEGRPTADGQLVFASTRQTVTGDPRIESNIWVMPYGQEGTGTPVIAALPRFFSDPNDSTTQMTPVPRPGTAQAGQMLFISNTPGNDDIFLGTLTDAEAPYITEPPTVTPKVAAPGGVVTVSVPVVDQGTGVRKVWLQIKDPDTAATDGRGENHVITARNANGYNLPVEFGPFNPVSNNYPDLALATSHPGYYARAGAVRLFADEGQGYPTVPTHWLPMYDDGTHGDAVVDDGVYTCQWTTPAIGSDWYLDIVTEDSMSLAKDATNQWYGNRRRFDNVGGCSTAAFTGARRILLVDDYMDGQRFLSVGLPPVTANYDAVAYLNSPYYFTREADTTASPTPFAPGSEFGGADIWRLLARGPVPANLLNTYLPAQISQASPSGALTNVTVRHADKLVVWVSPSSWNHLIGPTTGGTGSLLDTTVQTQLTSYVNNGGRLFVIGWDLASGLTAGGTKPNSFLTTTLAAKLLKQSMDFTGAGANLWAYRAPHSLIKEAEGYWYGYSLPTPRWAKEPTRGVSGRNDNPSQYIGYNPATNKATATTWDHLDNLTDSNGGICSCNLIGINTRGGHTHATRGTGTTWDVTSTSKDTFNNGGRLVFWSFGYEHITQATGNTLTLDTLEWLQDGAVSGTVVRVNDMQPLANALVTVNEVTTIVGTPPTERLKAVAAGRTNAQGRYTISGIRPISKNYRLVVVANGYYGTTTKDLLVPGGKTTSGDLTNFFLNRDINTAILWGFVTQNGAPVVGAAVTATPVGGAGTAATTSDANGRYEFTDLSSGPYSVSATHPTTNQTASATPNPTLAAGETQRADILLATTAPTPRTLSGTVTGSGLPVAGATILLKRGTQLLATLTADMNGAFSVADLAADTYTLDVSAPGFISLTRTVVFDPIAGARLTLELTPLSTDPGTGRISGRVYDASTSSALGGATVELLVGSTVKATQITTAVFQNGTTAFNFDFSVASGSYQLRVSKTGFRTQMRSVDLAPGASVLNQEFRLEPLLSLGTGVLLFSLPGDYSQQLTATVFGLSLGNDGALLDRLATYNTAARDYSYYTLANRMPLQPGRAYWSRLDIPLTVSAEATPIDATQPYPLSVRPGWNLIGNPFPFTVDIYECGLLVDNAPRKSWNDAVMAGLVGGAVYTWGGRDYLPSTMLQPYKGYWIFVSAQGADLRMEISNRSSSRAVPLTRAARRSPSATRWQVRLEARAGEYRDGANYFGVAPDGQEGYSSRLDQPEPPTPPGGHVTLAFPHRAWGADSGDFAHDIQAPGAGVKRWQFRVATDQPNTDVVLGWPELAAQLPAGMQVELRDLHTGQSCYLNTTSRYLFRTGPEGAARDFELVLSPHVAGLMVSDVRGMTAGSGRAETLVSFNLTEAARVQVVIRTATGRLVRTLATHLAADAGLTTLTWDRRDAAGRAMPLGNYLVEVQAATSTGRQARGAGLVSLVSLR